MTVGKTLTEARNQAGLSVEQLSERTRIRGTVIRSIEQDDYEACGGDLYVRGYVRAIAGAVGIDAQPLITEYDLGKSGSRNERASGSAGRHARGYPRVSTETAPTTSDLMAIGDTPPASGGPAAPADAHPTRFDMPVVNTDPADTSYDLPPVVDPEAPVPSPPVPPAAVPQGTADTRYDMSAVPADPAPTPENLMDAGYDLGREGAPGHAGASTQVIPGMTHAEPPAAWSAPATGQPGATAGDGRKRQRRILGALAGVAVLVAVGLTVHLATDGAASNSTAASTVPGATASAAKPGTADAQAKGGQANASTGAQASAPASAKPTASPVAPAASLPVASALAYGPDGVGDGDDPGDAANVIAAHPSQPWRTQWYATSEFGQLKHGTGLLLDLGAPATVATVRLGLSQFQGTDLQLRAGNSQATQALTTVATANRVAGTVTLTLHNPSAARYLLIWITQLPPDGQGHFTETISHVSLTGHR